MLVTNARSLKNKADYLTQLLDDRSPTIAIVTETWMRPEWKSPICAKLIDCGYHLESTERQHGILGGGTLVLVRQDYAYSIKRHTTKPLPPPRLAHCGRQREDGQARVDNH